MLCLKLFRFRISINFINEVRFSKNCHPAYLSFEFGTISYQGRDSPSGRDKTQILWSWHKAPSNLGMHKKGVSTCSDRIAAGLRAFAVVLRFPQGLFVDHAPWAIASRQVMLVQRRKRVKAERAARPAKVPVLVTGGAGYIGSHAVIALRDAGWGVAVIDNLSTGFAFAVPADIPFYQGDISDSSLLQRIFTEQGTGAIMHFAGSVVVPESVENPLRYYDNNTSKSRVLIEAAVNADIPHFVFSSTAAIYGIPDVGTVTENAAKEPINPYGWSKLMTERMLADASSAHGFNFCAMRYFNVAGADPQARTGQSTAGATHLIKVACEAATGRRASVAIFGKDFDTHDGTGVRDYIHVSDLAAAHVLALEALIAQPETSFTFNCGYGRGFSVAEVLDAVDRVTGSRIERQIQPRRAGDPGRLVSDPSLIKATLPWRPLYDDLETIVRDALAWERKLENLAKPG